MDFRLYFAVFVSAAIGYALAPYLGSLGLGLPLGLDQGLVAALVAAVAFAIIDKLAL